MLVSFKNDLVWSENLINKSTKTYCKMVICSMTKAFSVQQINENNVKYKNCCINSDKYQEC